MINLSTRVVKKPQPVKYLLLLLCGLLLMHADGLTQKYVDIRTDVCARIEKINNGNGQYASRFNGFAAGSVTTFEWHTTSTNTRVQDPRAAGSGTYYLYRYATAGSCYSPASNAVTVTINATPTATVSGNPATACAPNTINLNSVNTSSGSDSYQWHTVASNPTAATQVANPTRISSNGTC